MPNDKLPPLAVVAIPAFQDNYLWLLVRGKSAAVVDPGDAAPVRATLERLDLDLCAIVLTHHHRDHIGGVSALCAAYGAGSLPVYGPAAESIAGVTVPLEDGAVVRLESLALELQVIAVPGHTRGHIAYYADVLPRPLLFCGDTLFGGGCGRLFEGTPVQMQASLARLAALPDATLVYCAHEYTLANLRFARAVEPDNAALLRRELEDQARRARSEPTVPFALVGERATNPFLRWDAPAVKAAAEARVKGASLSAAATFAAIRAWKDRF